MDEKNSMTTETEKSLPPMPGDGHSTPQVCFGGLSYYMELIEIYENEWPLGLA